MGWCREAKAVWRVRNAEEIRDKIKGCLGEMQLSKMWGVGYFYLNI